jgi:dihydrofolate synthase / folylpolyglutamate synthase
MVFLPHWPIAKERSSMKLNLHRIKSLLRVLGDPHKKLPVIHVAGTNGKGSTVAFIRSILEKAGLTVHVFTSPHIERFNERISLAGSEIADDYLYAILEECRIAAEKHNIEASFFEGTTAAAFLAFSRHSADIVILEVGLGGRLDATNVIENPLISVITPISYDHTNILGNSLKKIAAEKACIIKPKIPCVVSLQRPEVHKVIENYADKQNSPLIRYEYDFGVSIEKGLLSYKAENLNIKTNPPSLLGYHQYINAAAAIATVSHIKEIKITPQHIAKGITSATWKGRLQKITCGRLHKLLPVNWELFVDAAHNEAGAQSCAAWLKDQKKMKTCLIVGMTQNRDPEKFLKQFQPLVSKVICVSIDHEPMNYQAHEMIELIHDKKLKAISFAWEKVEDALLHILHLEQKSDKIRIIVTGSIFLIADFFARNRN